MDTLKHFILLSCIILALAFLLSGCCKDVQVKYFEKVPTVNSHVVVNNSVKLVNESFLTNECKKEPFYSIDFGTLTWLDQPVVEGVSNQAKRTVTLKNPSGAGAIFYFDKIYLVNGKEFQRYKPSFKQVIPAKSEKKIYLAWYSEYSPSKDVTLELINLSSLPTKDVCGYVKSSHIVSKPTTSSYTVGNTTYETVIKYKTVLSCIGN